MTEPGEKPESRPSNSDMTSESTYRPPSDRLDRTKLAAFIDGRLAGAERDAVLTRVAASPTDLEIVADALAVAAELDEDVTDIQRAAARRALKRPRATTWVAIAAAIVVVATVPLMSRMTRSGVDGYASLLVNRSPLGEGWEAHSWSATRGANDGISERVRAVRVGALTSTLDVAAAMRDSAALQIAGQIAALLDDVSGASSAVAAYRDVAKGGALPSIAQLREARNQARRMVTPNAFDDGAWLEAARIAASEHDTMFFVVPASRDRMKDLAGFTSSNARTQADMKSLNQIVDQRNWNWDALANSTTNILAQLAAP